MNEFALFCTVSLFSFLIIPSSQSYYEVRTQRRDCRANCDHHETVKSFEMCLQQCDHSYDYHSSIMVAQIPAQNIGERHPRNRESIARLRFSCVQLGPNCEI